MKYILKIFFDKIIDINIILKWFTDENDKIFRVENIEIPLIAEISEFIRQNKMIIFCWITNIKIMIGINFCNVIKINAIFHLIPSITEIIQKWNGNIPNFIKIDKNIIIYIILLKFLELNEIDNKIILDEILWIRKYIMVDFSLRNFWFVEIMGIIENRLISILIHIVKNEFDETQIKILLIKDIMNKFFWINNSFFIS